MSETTGFRRFLRGLSTGLIGAALVGPIHGQERPQRGKVVYEGTYNGKQTEGFVLFNQGPQLVGAVTLTVDFDGNAIRATYKTTGKLAGGTATGVVEGDVCKLFGPGNLTIEADCTGNTFNGKLFQQPKPELRRSVTFELVRRPDLVETTSPVAAVAEVAPPPTAPVATGESPANTASVSYQGVYSGARATNSRGGSKEDEMSGAFTVNVEFDGPAVVADFKTTGTIRSFRMTGSRNGVLCKLFDRGGVLEGVCSKAEFDAILRGNSGSRAQLNVQFKGAATKVVDVEQQREANALERAKREKEQAEQRAKREVEQAEQRVKREAEQAVAAEVRKREEDAERARQEKLLQSLPPVKK